MTGFNTPILVLLILAAFQEEIYGIPIGNFDALGTQLLNSGTYNELPNWETKWGRKQRPRKKPFKVLLVFSG